MIKSVVAKEGLKGYVYIESFKQTHVKAAIEGIGNLRMGYYKQQVCFGLLFFYRLFSSPTHGFVSISFFAYFLFTVCTFKLLATQF